MYYTVCIEPILPSQESGSSSSTEDVAPMVAVIRKVTLALATRIRDLERESKLTTQQSAAAKAQLSAAHKEKEEVSAHYTAACLEIKSLEGKVQSLSGQLGAMISNSKSLIEGETPLPPFPLPHSLTCSLCFLCCCLLCAMLCLCSSSLLSLL